MKFVVDSRKHKRRRSVSVALPNSSPVKRYDKKKKKRFLHMEQVAMRAGGVTAMPRSFWRIWVIIFLPRGCSHVHVSGKPASYFFVAFQTSCGRFCIFSDRCIGHISRTRTKHKKRQEFAFAAWYMISTVFKNHIQKT